MKEDKLKEAFRKIREDMNFFHQEIESIKRTLESIEEILKIAPSQPTNKPSNQHIIPSDFKIPTHIPTLKQPPEAFKDQHIGISTGSEGVPTNQPTNHQTIQHPHISTGETQKVEKSRSEDKIEHLQKVSEILASLDGLKKEVRFKFKKLTNQEMLIYSIIYQLDELGLDIDYSLIAERLGLTEISIRDYVRKIINKGIPLNKTKEDNKKVRLNIPTDLKKIASLKTILELREL